MMSVRVVTSEADFQALRSQWQTVFQSNPNLTPLQSWEWNYTWWKHFGRPGDLRLILVEQDGRLLGVAPLHIERRFRGLPLKHLRLLAHVRADYQDFPVRSGEETAFFGELAAYLRQGMRGAGFIELRDIAETSSNLQPLLEAMSAAGLHVQKTAGEKCVTVPLAPSYDAFLGRLSKHFRKDVGYYRRAFERTFKARFTSVSSAPEAAQALDDLIAVYRARWREEKILTHFDQASTAAFERDACSLLSAAGLYQLYLLYADEKPVAGMLGYRANGRCFIELFAHSPEYHKYSVGTVLLSRAIEDAIAQGCTELDLMRGDEPYKYRWSGQPKQNYNIRIFDSRWKRQLVSSIDRLYLAASTVKALKTMQVTLRRWRLQRRAPEKS